MKPRLSAPARSITSILAAETNQNIEKTAQLISLLRPGQLSHQPPVPPGCIPVISLGHLLGHLLDCMAGFCAAFYVAVTKRLTAVQNLRKGQVNHFCKPAEKLARIRIYRKEIARGFCT